MRGGGGADQWASTGEGRGRDQPLRVTVVVLTARDGQWASLHPARSHTLTHTHNAAVPSASAFPCAPCLQDGKETVLGTVSGLQAKYSGTLAPRTVLSLVLRPV